MDVALTLGIVAISIAVLVWTQRWQARRVVDLADQLGGRHVGRSRVVCTRHGVDCVLVFSNGTSPYLTIAAKLPRAYPLVVLVRRRNSVDPGRIERGEIVHVSVGDAGFDREYLVEAAPADVARALFDPTTVAWLVRNRAFLLTTELHGDQPVLQLGFPTALQNSGFILDNVDQVARLASRVRDCYAAVDRPGRAAGLPYRPELEARDATADRAREVEQVRGVREARRPPRPIVVLGLIVGCIVGLNALLALVAGIR